MKRFFIGTTASALMLASMAFPAFANPAGAPGAGDSTDVANVKAGENPPLSPNGDGGLLNNAAGNPVLETVVFPNIIDHNPLCDVHDDLGSH